MLNKRAVSTHEGSAKEEPDLFRAARQNDLAEMEAALNSGKCFTTLDPHTLMTPIHIAAIFGSLDFIVAAIETGTPEVHWAVCHFDKAGNSPFEHALARRDFQTMAHLHNCRYPEAAVEVPATQFGPLLDAEVT